MKPAAAKPAAKKAPAPPLPGVCEKDELFAHIGGKPATGTVVCHGRHGVTLKVGDKHHKVRWEDVLGHKQRAEKRVMVVDAGDDGAIVEDPTGRRTFVAGYRLPEPEEATEEARAGGMAKSLMPKMLLFTAAPDDLAKAIKDAPGLALQDVTDKAGHRTKRWKRTMAKEKPGERRHARSNDGAGGKPPRHEDSVGGSRSAAEGYGTHNLEAGDSVDFQLGELSGAGKIVGKPGKDGAHVKDSTGKVHKVLWSEVTGHKPANGTKKPDAKPTVLGEQKPIPADRFSATEFAKSHDEADVTPESVLKNFPADTAGKIQETQRRLQSVEQTIDKHKSGGEYNAERQKLHDDIAYNGVDKIIDGEKKHLPGILSPERVAGATPPDGQAPTLIMLGGRGGSGKSWFKDKVYDSKKFIVLDADAIKEMMPEYEGWNAAQVHEESGELFDRIADEARALGVNVVLDATMKTAKSTIARLNTFKDAGYKTEAHYMHLPRQEAAKRAVSRFLGKTSRYVPADVALANTTNEHTFDQVKGMVDKWSFRDNNVAEKQDPILISDSEGKAGAPPAGDEQSAEPLKKKGGDATMKDGG